MDMDAFTQVIFLLQVVINLAPIAVYFLVLGLVNSQARPRLVDARSDFLALTLVFVPLMVWPVPFLLSNGLWWVLLLGAGFGAAAMYRLLPAIGSGWVVYNISEADCHAIFHRAARSLGFEPVWEGDQIRLPSQGVTIRFSALQPLRNVSLHVEEPVGRDGPAALLRIRERLEQSFAQQAQLPSLSGSCMVLLGVVLMMFPLWMTSRHMDAIVEVVTRLLT